MKRKYFLKAGNKIKHLTLIKLITTQDKRVTWQCQCDCGKIITRREDYLTRPLFRKRPMSCGCITINKLNIGSNNKGWKGCGDLSGQKWCQIKGHAKTRKLDFEITIEDAWNQFIKQNRRCTLTNQKLVMSCSRSTSKTQTASLDRIDNTKGYTKNNIQWVHKEINLMKHTHTQKHFIELCKAVAKHYQ